MSLIFIIMIGFLFFLILMEVFVAQLFYFLLPMFSLPLFMFLLLLILLGSVGGMLFFIDSLRQSSKEMTSL